MSQPARATLHPFGVEWLSRAPLWVLLILLSVTTGGCGGCLQRGNEKLSREELERRAKEQKEDLVVDKFLTLPTDAETKLLHVKPGHWIETTQQAKATREDLQVIASGNVLRGNDRMLNVPGTNVQIEFSRPTVLPKGQTKSIDLQYFVPTSTAIAVDTFKGESNLLRLQNSLLAKNLLTPIFRDRPTVAELPHYQFLFVVLSPKPDAYRYLSALDAVLWKGQGDFTHERVRSYQVILSEVADGKSSLPSSLLTLTMTAAILWDDVAPDDLSLDQQQALVDWLHWGGQLIISGPGSWARLQNSFLAPYLPARSAEVVELTTEDFAPLSKTWLAPDLTGREPEPLTIVGAKLPGLKMELVDGADWLPGTGDLVAERSVGRGRLVVSGFPLREPRIFSWKYFSSFVSTGLLRRPARQHLRKEGFYTQVWAPPYENLEHDPRLNSQLRITARDLPLSSSTARANPEMVSQIEKDIRDRIRPTVDPTFAGDTPRPPPEFNGRGVEGVQWSPNGAAWTDASGVTVRALSALRGAAGIVLPDRWTIIYLLGAYLTVLVPLNWFIFRLLGRLEYAWLAAPLIALVGVAVVTRVARLDIGFARRSTHLGVLELQGSYPRGHLTSYLALYSSLSTNYAVELPERGSVILPLGDYSRRIRRAGPSAPTVSANYGSSAGMRLEPLTVYSNSTEMLHAEQMLDLKGGLLYEGGQGDEPARIKNSTGLALRGCLAFRKLAPDMVQYAWLGEFPTGTTQELRFQEGLIDSVWKHWNAHPVTRWDAATLSDTTAKGLEEGQADQDGMSASALRIGGLLDELLRALPVSTKQTRLLAYCDDQPSRMVISPNNDQTDTRMVVLAHLTPPTLGKTTPDRNIVSPQPGDAPLPEPPPNLDQPPDQDP
jgi:hypothetical protein